MNIGQIGPQAGASQVVGSSSLPASPTFRQIYATPDGLYVCLTSGSWTLLDVNEGDGTVTSVSVVIANGVSGSVANASTTPAITLTLGAITPTTVNGLTISTTTGTLTLTNGKTLSVAKTMSLTAADDTGVYTLPTGTKTLLATDGSAASLTGLPISTGISGLGTGIATALAINTGSAGAPVLFNGAGGTPSSLTGTNITGTAASLTAGTATNATNGATVSTTTNQLYYPLMAASSSNGNQPFNLATDISFNPSTKTLNTVKLSLTGVTAGFSIVNSAITGTNYGVDSEVTGSGGTSNIAGYFAAAGASTTNNYAIQIPVNFPPVGANNYAIKSDSVAQSTLAGPLTATLFNGLAITNNATNTLNIAAGKTFVVSNGLTLAGTDSTTMTFPSTSATIARTDAGNTFTGNQNISGTISSYNGVATAGNGVPAVVATSPAGILAQTTAVGPVTVYTTPAADGTYEIFCYVIVYNVATSGTITATLGWTDADSNTAFTLASGNINVTPASQGPLNAGLKRIKASTAITITTVFNVVVGTPTYSVYVVVKKVG